MLSAGNDNYVSKWMTEGGQKYPQVSSNELWTNVSEGKYVRSVLILPNKTVVMFEADDDAAANNSNGNDITPFTSELEKGGITKGTVIADTEKPAVSITAPTAGISLTVGTAVSVKWTASDNIAVTAVKLEQSVNGGTSWTVISANTANDGTESWTPSAEGSYQIRVTASDAAGNSESAVSGTFTVKKAAAIDTSGLSVNLISFADWETSVDALGSKAELDSADIKIGKTVSAVFTLKNDDGMDNSYASADGSFEKAFSKTKLFKISYRSDQPIWFALNQAPRIKEGISYGRILPAGDTTLYLPLDSFAQPEWIDTVKEKIVLSLDSVSSFGFESTAKGKTTKFTLKELKASNYTIDPTALSSIIGSGKGNMQIVGMKLNFGTEMENGIVSVYRFDGRITASRTVSGTFADLGMFGLAQGAYLVRTVTKHGSSPTLKFTVN